MKKIFSTTLLAAFCFALFSFSTPPAVEKFGAHAKKMCTRVKAQLCGDCGFGNKKDNCVKCNKWVASSGSQAFLCGDCGFGNKKDNCVKCNKCVGSSGVKAQLCGDCSFGNKKDNCSKCNKWMGS